MIDLLITYDIEGWAFHRRAEALARHAPGDFRVRIARLHTEGLTPENRREAVAEALGDIPPDIVFVLGYHEARGVRRAIRERGWPTRLVVGWNNGWPNRREDLEKAFGPADLVIFNNRDCHDRAGRPEPSVVLPNGVDLDTFRIQTPIDARPRRVIWCGSERQGKLKGHDDLVVPLFARLRSEGIECEALLVDSSGRARRDAAAMAAWYDSATVLVVASESEGTPNVALEAAACGCTLVSTRVGNMPELVRDGENGFLVERDLESLYHGVRRALADYPRLAANLARDIRAWGWPERVREFFDAFRRVVAPAPALEGDARPDRSDELTVFVSTVGAPSFPECLACLERQDCRFRLEVIANVAPMSAAFQAMMDRCRTPYYIQVDEDMLLRPHAVRTLGDRIKAAAPEVALTVAWLWDDHLDRYVQGVKAFRHAVVSRYPFADVQSCEKDQVRRMAADGHPIMRPPERYPDRDDRGVLGIECGPTDPSSAFERYATLEQRRVRNPDKLAWFAPYAVEFLRRFREDPSEMNLMSLLGVLAGRRTAADERLGEKDFRTYDSLPGLREALAFRSGCPAPVAPPATIVLPLRAQRDEWLRVALDSALGQTVPTEVIVVTSPFTPMSNRAVLALAAANPRLVVVERPDGAGFADAINLGIHRARADRVGLLLTDDWLSPEAVERCLAEDADIVSTGMVSYAADGVRVLRRRVADPARYARLGTNEERASNLKHFLLFRREAVLAAGGVDPSIGLTGADDYDLPWTLLDRGATVRLVPEPLYHYRDHDAERLTLRDRESQVKDLRKVLAKHGVVGDEAERLVREKSRWYGVPGHVAIVDPEWHLAGAAGDDRRPVDGAIARTMVELGRRPVRTAFRPSGGWHIECANDIAFRARLVEPARAERIARLAALAAGVPLAPLVACRDGVVVERWISGPNFAETIDDPALAEQVGRLFGGLSASAAGHREFRPWRRPVEPLLVDLDARLARLVANGDLDGAVAERLAARARSNAPDRVSAGLVHVDDRPSSVVCAPDGPVLVGNHHLEVGLTDRYLARIWGRWPMASAARNCFLRGYGSVRSTRRFLLHELFWAIDTLVAAAADSEGEILRRHIAALEVLAAGELPSDWRSPPANDREAPVRVAFLCDWLSIGGQERNALETIRGLHRRRFSPFLYAFLGGSMEPSFRALGIPMAIGSDRDPGETRDWNAAAMIESKIYRGNLGSCLARDRIDAAVVFGYRHAAWALQAAGVPVAIERLDGPNLIDHVSDKGRFDRVVAQSVTLRDLTAKRAGELGIEAERIEVVFPGVDLARFDPSRVDRDAARASLGFADDELVIGTVGRLIPGKNIGSLVEAFAALPTPDLRDRSRLLVVGPDLGELGRLTALAASLGVADRVVFVPGTDDVSRHLAAMDLFVMTSKSEGIPSALLEAMAMGLPAVTTGCGSIPEVIDGNALVLDDAEPGRLARAIARLLARPGLRRAMGGRARSIAARFAARHAVGRYEAMILECLRAKGYPPSHESAH